MVPKAGVDGYELSHPTAIRSPKHPSRRKKKTGDYFPKYYYPVSLCNNSKLLSVR